MKINNLDFELEEHFKSYYSEKEIDRKIFDKIFTNKEILNSKFSIFSGQNKIAQTVLQSMEIDYGNFLEGLINIIINNKHGVTKLPRNIKSGGKKNEIDSHFLFDDEEYIIEIKKRDNHDSTKWKGQIINLHDKVCHCTHEKKRAVILFIDDSYKKKHYKNYNDWWSENSTTNTRLDIYYGKQFFDEQDFLDENDWEVFYDYSQRAIATANFHISEVLTKDGISKEAIDNLLSKVTDYKKMNNKRWDIDWLRYKLEESFNNYIKFTESNLSDKN